MLLNLPRAKVSFTNVENGKTLDAEHHTTKITYPEVISLPSTSSGVAWRIVVPGKGLVIADVGQAGWLVHYDKYGNITSSKPLSRVSETASPSASSASTSTSPFALQVHLQERTALERRSVPLYRYLRSGGS